ncbi:MAG: GAF domain-containing protein [Nitrospirota bacterium]|jgi:two-component system NtrC family sensor kinase
MGVSPQKKTNSLLETLEHLDIPAALYDADGTLVAGNAAWAGLLEDRPWEGKRLRDVFPGALPDGACFPAGEHARPLRARTTLPGRDGAGHALELTLSAAGELGVGLLVVKRSPQEPSPAQMAKELTLFHTFAGILSEHSRTEDILEALIKHMPPIMGVEAGWVHLVEQKTGKLTLRAEMGTDRALLGESEVLRPGECLAGKALSLDNPLVVGNASQDPRLCRAGQSMTGIESLAAVPIRSKGVTWGVLTVASRKPEYFSREDLGLLTVIAGQLGVAIENARLIEQLREKMREIELINELSGTVNSSLSIGTVFRIMVSEIRKIFQYDRASLLLYQEDTDNLLIFALDTQMKTVMPKGVTAPVEGTSAGWVVRNNRPWINGDLAKDVPFALDRKLRDEGIRSTISIPLWQDKMLGVFNLDSTRPGAYGEEDLELLLPVSKHIAIALENSLLFEEISRDKKEWEKTFDAITDMVWIEDMGRSVLRANQALLARTGLSAREVGGLRCEELLGRIGVRVEGRLCANAVQARRAVSLELKGEDGGIFHSWAYPLSDDEGRIYAVVHYLKDVTAQKRLEQQLIRADKLASLGTLVAGIAHEINNPLGIIAGYSEALLDRAKDEGLSGSPAFEDFPEYLKTIHGEIFRCKAILGSLLEFSRPHRGQFRELDVNELLKEVILLVNHRAKRLNCQMEFDLNRDLPKVQAEPGALRQLFMNIIINAMYYTPDGGTILIRSGYPRGAEPGEEDRGTVSVSISDSGPGIPAGILEKIFDPFFTTKPPGEGTGLGLSICHKIAQEHGGVVDAESAPGRGSTFTVRLPAKKPAGKGVR